MHMFYRTSDIDEKFEVQQDGRGPWHNHTEVRETNTGLKSLSPS